MHTDHYWSVKNLLIWRSLGFSAANLRHQSQVRNHSVLEWRESGRCLFWGPGPSDSSPGKSQAQASGAGGAHHPQRRHEQPARPPLLQQEDKLPAYISQTYDMEWPEPGWRIRLWPPRKHSSDCLKDLTSKRIWKGQIPFHIIDHI